MNIFKKLYENVEGILEKFSEDKCKIVKEFEKILRNFKWNYYFTNFETDFRNILKTWI